MEDRTPPAERLRRALAAIDAANRDDPHRLRIRGTVQPKELAHAQLVTEWVETLCPEPSEALRLAARAHHLRRWTIPRSDYPEGRAGYLRWRTDLKAVHAAGAAEIMAAEGYAADEISRVRDLIQKKGLGREPEVQVLEDALCLVFLETQLEDVSDKLAEAKLVDVLRRTLRKMSPAAIERARALPLADAQRALLERARAELAAPDSRRAETQETRP